MAEGYRWTGFSSTYAHPPEGAPREIIPAEFVFYSQAQPQSGWYAGIEFSGRTRVSIERTGDGVKSVLGLNPDPGPFRTRLVPGGSLKPPPCFWVPSRAVPTEPPISFVRGYARFWATRSPGKTNTTR